MNEKLGHIAPPLAVCTSPRLQTCMEQNFTMDTSNPLRSNRGPLLRWVGAQGLGLPSYNQLLKIKKQAAAGKPNLPYSAHGTLDSRPNGLLNEFIRSQM